MFLVEALFVDDKMYIHSKERKRRKNKKKKRKKREKEKKLVTYFYTISYFIRCLYRLSRDVCWVYLLLEIYAGFLWGFSFLVALVMYFEY